MKLPHWEAATRNDIPFAELDEPAQLVLSAISSIPGALNTHACKTLPGCAEPPIHTARIVREWLEENGIDVLEWPPYSPDLNPIEHLWFRLKNLVYQVNPDIEKVGGNVDTVREALFEALERAWTMIPEDLMLDLIRSMQRRVEAVIAAEGWYTRY